MSNPPAFQLYAADFYMDTISWTSEEVGCSVKLLAYQWVNGTLPTKKKYLAQIAGCSPRRFDRFWHQLSNMFIYNEDGLFSPKLAAVRHKISMPSGYSLIRLFIKSIKPRTSTEYKNWRKAVLKRDNYECVKCNSVKLLHVHHKIRVIDDLTKMTDISNGLTLCRSCHKKEHGKNL